MRPKVLDVLSAVTAVAALTLTGFALRDRLAPNRMVSVPTERDRQIKYWETLLADGQFVGPNNAPVKIIEFADYECPVCQAFEKTLNAALLRHPDDVQLVYRHWPLPYHRHAYAAARAAECAAEQGRFVPFHRELYRNPDRLGFWIDLAKDARVPDLAAFERCATDTIRVAVIERTGEVVKKLDLSGTPTIIINGLRLGAPPDSARLEQLISAAKSRSTSL